MSGVVGLWRYVTFNLTPCHFQSDVMPFFDLTSCNFRSDVMPFSITRHAAFNLTSCHAIAAERLCPDGRHGVECQGECRCRDVTELCQLTTGGCRSGCPDGYTGLACDQSESLSQTPSPGLRHPWFTAWGIGDSNIEMT